MPAPQLAQAIRLYGFRLSGHAHRVQLFLSLLDLPVDMIYLDLRGGEQKRPGFLAKNLFGQVPVIEDGDVTVADSNAILVYLATKYGEPHWLPRDAEGAAAVQRFLSVAAGEIARGPALARSSTLFGAPGDRAAAQALAARLFGILDAHLAGRTFLVGTQPSIADVACYSYIARAPEGGVALEAYPNLRNWLAGVEALPRFVPMPASDRD